MRRYANHRRRGRRAGSTEKIAGLALGVIVAASAGGTAAAHSVSHPSAARSAGVRVAGGSETAFWQALLADMGAPASQANLDSLDAWLPHEEPWPSLAAWNPLDSTQPEPGSWVFNSVGVQNYPDASEGAQADAVTLENGNYPMIVAALRSGSGVCGPSFAAEFSTWSGGGYTEVC
jgi:hypothetical protein